MLTLFVLKSGKAKIDPQAAVKSFGDVVFETVHALSIDDLNKFEVHAPWFGVIHDNEKLDADLQAALRTFLTWSAADVLVMYKKASEAKMAVHRCPRIFRKGVKIRQDCLLPVDDNLKFDTILNGWIDDINQV
jgi:hypothetical protein